jgi:hypothetical protein
VGLAAAVATVATNLAVLAFAKASFNIPEEFLPLAPVPVALWSTIGVMGATGVFALVARRSARPIATFRVIALAVLLISLVPNLFLLATSAMPGTTAPGVLSLMVMHLVAAGFSVGMLTTLAHRR